MKYTEYTRLKDVLSACRSRRDLQKEAEKHGFGKVPSETLISIYSLEMQIMRTKAFHEHNKEEVKKKYHKLFFKRIQRNESQVILNMASEWDLSPCMLIRFILDVHMKKTDPDKYSRDKARASAITDILRNPHTLNDPALACAVQEAVYRDDIFGPFMDRIRRFMGLEFEVRLQTWCKEKNLEFLSEDDMRKQGYDKTPDIKLTMPIVVDGYPVNWIESKAMFGDIRMHSKHVQDQLGPYTYRFGQGLVIYWFGFIDELNCQRESGIVLSDGFPKTVTKIDLKLWESNTDWEFPTPDLWQPEVKRV